MLEELKNSLNCNNYISLEITPNHGISNTSLIEKIKIADIIKNISSFVITDSPLARLKSNSIVTAYKLQSYFKKPSIATITMRDRNKIALQSDILGANELDIRAILCLTGDSAKVSNQPNVKGVFEANSLFLLEIIKCFNSGIDYSGHPLNFPPNEIAPFVVCNARAKYKNSLVKKLAQKLKYNPLGVITQPVYSKDNAIFMQNILSDAKQNLTNSCDTELILGFFPVTKLRTAQFLNSHVPGVYIPEFWIEKLSNAKKISEEEERKVGIELSQKAYKNLIKIHPKIHLMGANNFNLLQEIISG